MPPRWDRSASAAENAGAQLPPLVRTYFENGRKLIAENPPPDVLHKFRLETKRLRYTLELFRTCYGPQLERHLAELRKIQDWLGAISDYATTRELLGGRITRRSAAWQQIEDSLTARTREKLAEFRSYWRQTFDKSGQEERWVRYLSRVPRAK
jgi:CHAD domain-containing protein